MAVVLSLSAIPLIAAAGGAVDWARYNSARTELQATLDAAVLAGTQAYAENGGDLSAAVAISKQFYAKEMESAGYQLTRNEMTFDLNAHKNGIVAHGNVDMATGFLNVVGILTLPLLNNSDAEASVAESALAGGNNFEVALMIDTTGSMCTDGNGPCTTDPKIATVKTASKNLIDSLIPASLTNSKSSAKISSRISIVPFATQVRVESDGQAGPIFKALTNLDPTSTFWATWCDSGTGSGGTSGGSEHNGTGGTWTCTHYALQHVKRLARPCVTDRAYNSNPATPIDTSDTAPGANNWLEGVEGDRMNLSADSTDLPLTSGRGLVSTDPSWAWNYSDDGSCGESFNSNQLMPLSSDPTALKARIDGLTAYGATAGALGTAMTWYTISPNFSAVWGAQSAAGSYSDVASKKLRKVAILMTDGGYNSYRSWKDQDITMISNAAKDTCANMKEKGIEIYTVAFDFTSLSSAEAAAGTDTLTHCATDNAHYYKADHNADLVAAFNNIAIQIAEGGTRLTK